MKLKPYVGLKDGLREVFASETEPTATSHPQYNAVVGPFRTVRGAKAMIHFGVNNPHIVTVADSERVGQERKHELRALPGRKKLY